MTLSNIIQQIDQQKQELDALRPILPEREAKIKQTFRLWWNYHSNAIEGNQLTLGETISLILHDLTAKGKSYKDHREVKGHDNALRWVEEIIEEIRPITQYFIRDLHKMILKESYFSLAKNLLGQIVQKKIKIGEYKTTPNHVETPTGEIFYYTEPDDVIPQMDDLLQWYEKEKEETHPLILAATFHYRFVKIHPFDDGNGRMSRILMNLILMRGGYPPAIIKMEKRSEYLAALSEADAGELEKFILFVGESLLESIDLYIRGAKGENIAEEDDLDKKIQLLKLQLKSDFDKVEKPIEHSLEIQAKLFDESFKSLFIKLDDKLSKFDDLFLKTNHGILAGEKFKNNNFIQVLEREFKGRKRVGVVLSFDWKKFKLSHENNFDISIFFDFTFMGKKYEITVGNNLYKISKKYNEQLSQEEITQLVNTITEKVLTEIQEKTNTQLS